jgi:hypothetical protein
MNMQSIDKNSIIKALKNFRFIIVDNTYEDVVLGYLRNVGIVNLFQIHRVKSYTIIELNTASCERECNSYCVDNNGRRTEECHSLCVATCIDERMENIIKKLS